MTRDPSFNLAIGMLITLMGVIAFLHWGLGL